MKIYVAVVAAVLMACGSSTTTGGVGGGTGTGGGEGTGGGTTGAGGGTSGTGGGSGAVALTIAECQADMDLFINKNCTDKAQWEAAKAMVCPKIGNTSATLCNAALVRAKACDAQFKTATIACNGLGATDSADPCAVDVLLGVFCVASTNNNNCAGIPCGSVLDCPTGFGCNVKMAKCFKDSASCLGLPCSSSLHCPTNQACNSSISQCVKN